MKLFRTHPTVHYSRHKNTVMMASLM